MTRPLAWFIVLAALLGSLSRATAQQPDTGLSPAELARDTLKSDLHRTAFGVDVSPLLTNDQRAGLMFHTYNGIGQFRIRLNFDLSASSDERDSVELNRSAIEVGVAPGYAWWLHSTYGSLLLGSDVPLRITYNEKERIDGRTQRTEEESAIAYRAGLAPVLGYRYGLSECLSFQLEYAALAAFEYEEGDVTEELLESESVIDTKTTRWEIRAFDQIRLFLVYNF